MVKSFNPIWVSAITFCCLMTHGNQASSQDVPVQVPELGSPASDTGPLMAGG